MMLSECRADTAVVLDRLTAALQRQNPMWRHRRVAQYRAEGVRITSVRTGSLSVIESTHWALVMQERDDP